MQSCRSVTPSGTLWCQLSTVSRYWYETIWSQMIFVLTLVLFVQNDSRKGQKSQFCYRKKLNKNRLWSVDETDIANQFEFAELLLMYSSVWKNKYFGMNHVWLRVVQTLFIVLFLFRKVIVLQMTILSSLFNLFERVSFQCKLFQWTCIIHSLITFWFVSLSFLSSHFLLNISSWCLFSNTELV